MAMRRLIRASERRPEPADKRQVMRDRGWIPMGWGYRGLPLLNTVIWTAARHREYYDLSQSGGGRGRVIPNSSLPLNNRHFSTANSMVASSAEMLDVVPSILSHVWGYSARHDC